MSEIAELFSRDPLQLTDQDLDKIIARLRESRAQFQAGDKKAGTVKTKLAKDKPLPGPKVDINLDDLEL